MTTDAITSGTGYTGTAQGATNRLSADYQSFLTLLTAQLMNQNPLEPMDSSTFVTQLAQLSQVEQAVTTNAHLEQISAELSAQAMLGDLQLIGRTVTVPSTKLDLTNGSAQFSFSVAPGAEEVSARILADDGTLIREFTGLSTAAGKLNKVEWDGKDLHGLTVPDGRFKIEVTAKDPEGKTVATETYAASAVVRLSLEGGYATLHLANGETTFSGMVVAVE